MKQEHLSSPPVFNGACCSIVSFLCDVFRSLFVFCGHCVFVHCVFDHCVFDHCVFGHCVFGHCVFDHCVFCPSMYGF